MPMLGLTMEEGTVAEWLKQRATTSSKDEPLLTVEMDKGTQEVPSPVAGVLRRIVVQAGTTVPVQDADRRDRSTRQSKHPARQLGGIRSRRATCPVVAADARCRRAPARTAVSVNAAAVG